MTLCNDIQERIARGDTSSADDRDHAATCASCAAVIADFSLLEATLHTFEPAVPAGFADRVMARLETAHASMPLPSRRVGLRMQLALAYAGGLLAVINAVAFIARIFIASVAFGGTP
jgi:hypothetical protein